MSHHKPATDPHQPATDPHEPAQTPLPQWKPEFLGRIWTLNRHVAPFMPSHEGELIAWLQAYLAEARGYLAEFPDVFDADELDALQDALNAAREWATHAEALHAHQRAVTAFKNIVLYLRDPARGRLLDAPEPPAPPLAPPVMEAGLVAIVEEQVRRLREHPRFNQIVAEALGVIPPRPHPVDPATLDPGGHFRVLGNDGREIIIELRYHGIAGLEGVDGVKIEVERGLDGEWHALTFTQRASFVDMHLLPARASVWRYRLSFANRFGIPFGKTSIVSVAVAPAGT